MTRRTLTLPERRLITRALLHLHTEVYRCLQMAMKCKDQNCHGYTDATSVPPTETPDTIKRYRKCKVCRKSFTSIEIWQDTYDGMLVCRGIEPPTGVYSPLQPSTEQRTHVAAPVATVAQPITPSQPINTCTCGKCNACMDEWFAATQNQGDDK